MLSDRALHVLCNNEQVSNHFDASFLLEALESFDTHMSFMNLTIANDVDGVTSSSQKISGNWWKSSAGNDSLYVRQRPFMFIVKKSEPPRV